ncbi:MAG TPA: Ldh family oxidoreductase [Opitutaceae bacterium]
MTPRYAAADLISFACKLLESAGLASDKAAVVAAILVEGDLLGHTTHGLALLPSYLTELETGRMLRAGDPEVLSDAPAALVWDGRRLPGPWLVQQALAAAVPRARELGTSTVVIRRSHHIACLAAYLGPIADQGLMAILTCSDPSTATVAPYGGTQGVFTPNPYAAAWPTAEGPVVFDISMSITTNGLVKRAQAEGGRLPGKWLVGPDGVATDDPSVMSAKPSGALLPVGGLDHGHKGYALALLVEALTGGLAGYGRADPNEGWSATVFLQVMDPALFGGSAAFARETGHVVAQCRANQPIPGSAGVRVPGESGLKRRAEQQAQGVVLHAGIMTALRSWAERFKLTAPAANA